MLFVNIIQGDEAMVQRQTSSAPEGLRGSSIVQECRSKRPDKSLVVVAGSGLVAARAKTRVP